MAKASKRSKDDAPSDDSDGVLQVSHKVNDKAKIKVRVNAFTGNMEVDIRKWVNAKGTWIRTAGGIRIPIDQWDDFLQALNDVDTEV